MSLDGFLTFLALAVGIYAIVSPVTKLRAKLGFGIQVAAAACAMALVLYLEFFEVIGQPCPAVLGRACKWLIFPADKSFTPPQAAFVVVLVWMGLAWIIHKFSRPSANLLPAMSRIIDELVYEQRYAEALKLVEPYLPLVGKVARRKLPLQRLHDWIASYKSLGRNATEDFLVDNIGTFRAVNQEEDKGAISRPNPIFRAHQNPIFRTLRRWFGSLTVLIPEQRKPEVAAQELAHVLFRSAGLRRFIAEMRPYFATAMLQLDLQGKYDFSDSFFGALISDSGSVLYQELEQNQNISTDGYYLPKSNRLLHFLFADARTAEQLYVWKPIGDHLLNILRPGEMSEYIEDLNRSSEGFDDAHWKDPTFVGIFFFDLMVTSAANQGVRWHMWLYYFPLIVERLVDCYDTTDPTVNTSVEFPTRSARLIYEALDKLGGWVRMIKHLPDDSPHRQIPARLQSDNENIPVSAAMALGSCMATIAMSDQLGDTFAGYMHEVIMSDIKGLQRDGVEGQMRSFLIQSIVNGGQRRPGGQYGRRLATFLPMADHVLRDYVDDYEAALKEAFPNEFM